MARPSKLSPQQWEAIERRVAEGEVIRALAREFDIDEAQIRRRVSPQTPQVRNIAARLAEVKTEMAAMPPRQQHLVMTLADKWSNISQSLASAAEHGAATAHRLHALANETSLQIDEHDVLNGDALRAVAALTEVANKSASIPLTLLSANRDEMANQRRAEESKTKPADSIVTARIAQLMAVAESRKKAQEQTA